ncbi:MAG: ChaB family protein [Alphaproteobacteria bacterium]|nr:ChaB family protein [Alphaproteobacteria bacterium]
MPYITNADLPDSVRHHLPDRAQTIYRRAFNGAWQSYAERGDPDFEEIAHRVAWSAVKRRYQKLGTRWMPRDTAAAFLAAESETD